MTGCTHTNCLHYGSCSYEYLFDAGDPTGCDYYQNADQMVECHKRDFFREWLQYTKED